MTPFLPLTSLGGQKYENLAFLKPLTSAMVRKNPDDRILAPEALALLQSLVRKQSWLSRRNRLREYGETRRQTILRDAKSFFREEVVLRTQSSFVCHVRVMSVTNVEYVSRFEI